MTLTTLILYIALASLVITLITHFALKATKNLGVSLLQNFCGAWFLFSGYVKVADPLGTAYKMEQYFDEFSSTAAGTSFSFLEPLFQWSSDISIYISMFMVVLEVVLGLMLILGTKPKFTAWAFFWIMVSFTILTGFTFLTGYVPSGSNFFEFSAWGKYVETNMRVTDCGCFGDFLKLEPYTSFIKDCLLMIPAVIFIVMNKSMHQLLSPFTRSAIGWGSVVAASLFGMSNFIWGLPIHDFRPFAEDVNIRERKALEEEAASNVDVLAYGITSKATGEYQELPYDVYMKQYKDFPSADFELEQITSELEVPHTKISEFELEDGDGNPVHEEVLAYEGYTAMFVAYKLYDKGMERKEQMVQDSMFVIDEENPDSPVRVFAGMQERSEVADITMWSPWYTKKWTEHVVPFADAAEAAGWKVFATTAYTDASRVDAFKHAVQFAHPIYEGDDIMLKTIIRSSPGLLILKDSKVIAKYHVNDIPDFGDLEL
ncbi:MAG: hypothetical protein AB8F78_11050 [Saprospiraceae bacterium]